MKTKLVEIRDSATRIAAIAIKTQGDTPEEQQLFAIEGFGKDSVLLLRPEQQKMYYDPFMWDNRRTMTTAHRYIQQHFDELPDAAVVDVQVILGETETPKSSEIWR